MTAEEALNKSMGVLNGYIKCTYVQLFSAPNGRFIISLQKNDVLADCIVTMTAEQYARKSDRYVPVTIAPSAIQCIREIFSGKYTKRGAITQGYQTLEDALIRKAALEVWVLESAIDWKPKDVITQVDPGLTPQPKKKAKKRDNKTLALLLAASSLLFN